MSDVPHPLEADSLEARRRFPITWLGLIAIGWLIYEITAEPALGAVAVCFKFGWEDFLTARWLRKHDPHRKRVLSNFWLYASAGLWKTTLVAFVMMWPLILVHNRNLGVPNRAQPPVMAELEVLNVVALTWWVGCLLSAIATFRAIWLAFRSGVRLWLGGDVHWARRRNMWPPWDTNPGASNHLGRIVLPSFIFAYLLAFIVLFIISVELFNNKAPVDPFFLAAVIYTVFIGTIIGLLFSYVLLLRRLLAASPVVAWGDDPGLFAGHESQRNNHP